MEETKSINPYIIAFTIILPTFFAMVATSGTNVCLPHIAGYFGATQYEANTVITSYMIANAVMLPLTGFLIRALGYKKLCYYCIILFALGSLFCVLASNLQLLIVSRIIQGIGGGPLMPIAQAILVESFPKEQRGIAMALFGFAAILPPLIGPFVGGYLTDNLSWQWVFIVNIPVCLISLILIKIFINEKERIKEKYKKKFDYIGLTSIIIWLGTMQIVLDKGQQYNWFDESWICWLTGISLFAMIFFIVWELEYKYPFVNIRVFKDINFFIGTIIGGFVNVMLYSTLLLVPMFVQSLLGYSPFWSGYCIAPRVISCAIMFLVVGKLTEKIDNRILIVIGLFILSATTFMFSRINLNASIESIMLPNFLFGAGIAFTFIPVSTMAFATLAPRKVKDGAGLHSLFKCVITAIATSMSATFIARVSQTHQTYLVWNLSPNSLIFQNKIISLKSAFITHLPAFIAAKKAHGAVYRELLQQARLCAFYDAFLFFAFVSFIIIPLVLFFRSKRKRKTA